MLDRALPDNMALRSDILAESRQKGAGNMSTEPVRMSRHVMWHERRAVQQKNRGRLSGKRGIFPVKQHEGHHFDLFLSTIRQKANFPHDNGVPGLQVRGGDVSLSARGA